MTDFIHIDDLELRMNLLPQKFTFIRVLHPKDQPIFKHAYIQHLSVEPLENNNINLYLYGQCNIHTWIAIMQKIDAQLTYHYRIYRMAYWGESTGNMHISNTMSPTHMACIIEFSTERIPTINLLIHDKHITTTYAFCKSYYANPQLIVWENDTIVF